MPQDKSIKKVLVIGSGPIVIGQAAEFDYAGVQACRVLKEAGVNVVLVNSNPATIMTDQAMADEIYLEPLTLESIERIIIKEKPDSLLAGLGGQTALTLAMQLDKDGFLEKHNVRLIGSNTEAIDKAEDRQLFKDTMDAINEPVIPSDIAESVEHAVEIAEKIGYPIIIRPAFTLGGAGGGVAHNTEEMKAAAKLGLDTSPIHQILVEKYIFGWKEIEFETMRDSAGNTIAICSMENFDPVGVHTGDSIVVAPALTLSDKEYQMLRSASLNIIKALDIVGGCNCQFALDPNSFQYAVIEVNPRVSRSSALASKATGYPIAKITTKIALGYTLDEITNDITGKTCACFEPALDYVVLKFPKWSFGKFKGASHTLGTQMKATGEVMSIAPNFESALLKAVRGAEISPKTLDVVSKDPRPVEERLHDIDEMRVFNIFEALKKGITIDEIHSITRIDKWFLAKIKNLVDYENKISTTYNEDLYLEGKKLGYTDEALENITHTVMPHINASFKMVDTCGAEFDAVTPYFYSTYDKNCEARTFPRSGKQSVIVLGSGPIRIGQGIEFDYSCVHSVWALKEMGYDVAIINNNPETVSTDYDTADRLYFEPLTEEDVMHVIEVEQPIGVAVAFGGQTAIKLTNYLDSKGIKILGTSAESIDIAEDRERFDELLESLNIKRPKGSAVNTVEEGLEAANTIGYPLLLRPSYVIGGENMRIVYNDEELIMYMQNILAPGIDNPVLIDKYMMGRELEVDIISDGTDILIPGVMQHVERTGVHSGDSIAVYPPYNINDKLTSQIIDYSTKMALALKTKGLINIQYLIYQNELFVIEVNPRASRTVPYISKVTGVPMIDLASKIMLGHSLKELGYGTGLYPIPPYVTVKAPVFSFQKLSDANAYLGPEMKSTGEVLGIGKNINEALFKGLSASGLNLQSSLNNSDTGILISVDKHDQDEIISLAKKFIDLGFIIYATPETASSIEKLGIKVNVVPSIKAQDGTFALLEDNKVHYIIYTGATSESEVKDYINLHRRALQLSIPCFTSLDTANALADIVASRYTLNNTELVDLCNMRKSRQNINFCKMQATGDDYIFIENFDNKISCPESLCVSLCNRREGIGGNGIVLIEQSNLADAKMRIFNSDGSLGQMAGNSIRCVAKYLYDHGIVSKNHITIETESGIKNLLLYTINQKVTYVEVNMGHISMAPESIPCTLNNPQIIDYPLEINGTTYPVTCMSVGNPHCVTFLKDIDSLDLNLIGPLFENADIFPMRTNTEFVRIINRNTIKMRVYERGNGETKACGTGACAAAMAAIIKGYCDINTDITVKVPGGDLVVRYDGENIHLAGNAVEIYCGTFKM